MTKLEEPAGAPEGMKYERRETGEYGTERVKEKTSEREREREREVEERACID